MKKERVSKPGRLVLFFSFLIFAFGSMFLIQSVFDSQQSSSRQDFQTFSGRWDAYAIDPPQELMEWPFWQKEQHITIIEDQGIHVGQADEALFDSGLLALSMGRWPENENEAVVSSFLLGSMDLPYQTGTVLHYTDESGQEQSVTICGILGAMPEGLHEVFPEFLIYSDYFEKADTQDLWLFQVQEDRRDALEDLADGSFHVILHEDPYQLELKIIFFALTLIICLLSSLFLFYLMKEDAARAQKEQEKLFQWGIGMFRFLKVKNTRYFLMTLAAFALFILGGMAAGLNFRMLLWQAAFLAAFWILAILVFMADLSRCMKRRNPAHPWMASLSAAAAIRFVILIFFAFCAVQAIGQIRPDARTYTLVLPDASSQTEQKLADLSASLEKPIGLTSHDGDLFVTMQDGQQAASLIGYIHGLLPQSNIKNKGPVLLLSGDGPLTFAQAEAFLWLLVLLMVFSLILYFLVLKTYYDPRIALMKQWGIRERTALFPFYMCALVDCTFYFAMLLLFYWLYDIPLGYGGFFLFFVAIETVVSLVFWQKSRRNYLSAGS